MILLKNALKIVKSGGRGGRLSGVGGLLVCSVVEVVHDHVQRDGLVWLAKKGLVVPWDEAKVVKRLVRVDVGGVR